MKPCPFCAEQIQDAATVCKHCTRTLPVPGVSLNQAVPTAFLLPMGVVLLGTFTMLISGVPGAPRLMLLPGWLISWWGAYLILKDYSTVIRVGGGFILSLIMMLVAASCGAQ